LRRDFGQFAVLPLLFFLSKNKNYLGKVQFIGGELDDGSVCFIGGRLYGRLAKEFFVTLFST